MPTDETKIALLEQKMEYLVSSFDAFTKRFDEWQKSMTNEFVPRPEIEVMFKNLNDEIKELKEDKKSNRSIFISLFGIGISTVFAIIDLIALYH